MNFFQEEEQIGLSKDELMNLYNSLEVKEFKVGGIVQGTIVSVSADYLELDINYKNNLLVQITQEEKYYVDNMSSDDMKNTLVKVIITSIVDTKNQFIIKGSIDLLKKKELDAELNELYTTEKELVAKVLDVNNSGYTVSVNHNDLELILFMPHNFVDINRNTSNSESLVGKDIMVIVDTISKTNKTYIASAKKYLTKMIPKKMKQLNKNTVYTGIVTGVKDYGLFIQFEECLTAMMYKTNLVEHLQDRILEIPIGTEIEFYFKDKISDKIYVTQNINKSLWDTIENNMELEGTVNSIKEYGILLDLDYETKGMLHKNEVKNMEIKEGDKIKVVVTNVNKFNRQISLKLAK